ncbi:MAG: hypothetical protein ACXWJJ_11490 [Ramlibacter sp.]
MSGTMHPHSQVSRGAVRRLVLSLALAAPAVAGWAAELATPATAMAAREGDARPAAVQFSRRLAVPQVAAVPLVQSEAMAAPLAAGGGQPEAQGPRLRPYRGPCNFTTGC